MRIYAFPGQGSQFRGMGADLFKEFPDAVRRADAILGYSLQDLCLRDPRNCLTLTPFTQPAVYVVNALSFLERQRSCEPPADYMLGHSLGEYSALFASGALDFETGLRIVQKRGQLMGRAPSGGMAAVLGIKADVVRRTLKENALNDVDIANYNSSTQVVISGPTDSIDKAEACFTEIGATYIPLNVGAAFHSRAMTFMVEEFRLFLQSCSFGAFKTPVLANVNAKVYRSEDIVENLVSQICGPVRWVDSIHYLTRRGKIAFQEVGPGTVLTSLFERIAAEARARPAPEPEQALARVAEHPGTGRALGSAAFRKCYGTQYAYAVSSIRDGTCSKEAVVRSAKSGLLGILGCDALSFADIEASVRYIQSQLPIGQVFGVKLPQGPRKAAVVDLCLRHGVRVVEMSDTPEVTSALVKFRLSGAHVDRSGRRVLQNRIIARVHRPQDATLFLSSPPHELVRELCAGHKIGPADAEMAAGAAMAEDLVVEANSEESADSQPLSMLLPAILKLRDATSSRPGLCIGAAGEIGTPEAIAEAFLLGADFVVTESINQCTAEGDTSDVVKSMLQALTVADVGYAVTSLIHGPDKRSRIMTKGVFFPKRAELLRKIWLQHDAWESLDPATRRSLESVYFRRTFQEVAREVGRRQPANGETGPTAKEKMTQVFGWYLDMSRNWAQSGDPGRRVDYQVAAGPGLGAFNQWAKGTSLEHWANRHVDEIGIRLMDGAADLLRSASSASSRRSQQAS